MSEFAGDSSSSSTKSLPVVVVVIGMAGAGKTTLMHRLNLHMQENEMRGYYLNLDPAVRDVPFGANIDIRDTINYKEVMKQYGLGPNGSILTSLNLFATRFDQVVTILEKRANDTDGGGLDYIFVDTPGQIESFTWSAGGQIILELLATAFPTVILYITDTPRSSSPTTFMSNMLYASSVLYKSQLPMVCVFNKTDVCPCDFALEWMQDFEAYQAALEGEREGAGGAEGEGGDGGEGYMSSLNRSLSLAMEEFYSTIKAVGVSAATGEGTERLFECFQEAAVEFQQDYLPELLRRLKVRGEADKARQEADLARLQQDLAITKGDTVVVDAKRRAPEAQGPAHGTRDLES